MKNPNRKFNGRVVSKLAIFLQCFKKNDVSISFPSVNAPQTGVSAFPPQSSAQHSVESVQPEAAKVASYSPEEDNTDISPGDMEFSDMENTPPAKKPTVSQVSAVKVQSDAHGSSNNEAKAQQTHIKPQPPSKDTGLTTKHPAQPVAPAQPVSPVQPVAPVQLVMPDQPVALAQPVAPAQTVSLPVHTIESTVGQSNGFMPQSAPLTASYNPAVAAPNLASMSRYFDSSSSSPNLLPQQPYYEPPKLQAPQQNFAPHPKPKKPATKSPTSEKPEVSPYSAFNVSISGYMPSVLSKDERLKGGIVTLFL